MRFLLAAVLVFGVVSALPVTVTNTALFHPRYLSPALPDVPLACDPDYRQASGAFYRICMPTLTAWNGGLIVYAHGYVSPTEPVGIPEDQMRLPDGTSLSDIVNLLGFAFATSSYSTNGLAVREGIADLVDLVDIFAAEKGEPETVYLVGASEGGIITALSVERHPEVFDGGLALCGPYGDFRAQINYWGDFRLVFDYFFPGLLPGSPVEIPDSLIANWDSVYETTVKPEIQDPANANLVDQLLNVTQAPYDSADPGTKERTVERLLWYNVFATNDGIAKLGGQPFDNRGRVYTGSEDDVRLNSTVPRFSAEQAALDEIAAHYETAGQLSLPLVTLHTTGDPIIPYWHVTRYRGKIILADNIALHEHSRVERYGHCSFTSTEVVNAFMRLYEMVTSPPAYQPVQRSFLPAVMAAP